MPSFPYLSEQISCLTHVLVLLIGCCQVLLEKVKKLTEEETLLLLAFTIHVMTA